jgi:N-acetylneuraminic acid mutarotase
MKKSHPSIVLAGLIVVSLVGSSSTAGTLLATVNPQASSRVGSTPLTFAERVAHQRAIEEVYWRHRTWPKENPGAKPALDAVVPQDQVEKKVRDYLQNSKALEDLWQRPLTSEQLQAEMDRTAQHTKSPGVLRELFQALGNDPLIIAECLARAALAERLVNSFYAHDQRFHAGLRKRAEADLQAHPTVAALSREGTGTYSEVEFVKSDSGQVKGQQGTEHRIEVNGTEWDELIHRLATTIAAVSDYSAQTSDALLEQIDIGIVSSLQEDESRYYATAILTKAVDRLKVATFEWNKEPFASWRAREGGDIAPATSAPNASYTLPIVSGVPGGSADDTWKATASAPTARSSHTAVWTGSEMIVWDGSDNRNVSTGGKYNPATDTWTLISVTNAPANRDSHTAVWTGSQVIVWGGYNNGGLATGGKYNPVSDTWTATSMTNAPARRQNHTAVWTGSQMIIWGGVDSNFASTNTGGRYAPDTDTWTPTSSINAPSARSGHTAVWTGNEMIVWGGGGGTFLNTGGRYNPETDAWTMTSTANAPIPRFRHSALWTGIEMIVWGGSNGDSYFNTGGRYNPNTETWIATSTANAPSARGLHTAVWTGSEIVLWGGIGSGGGSGALGSGAKYTPGQDTWAPISAANAPSARSNHTAVWTGSEMIVWGGSAANHFNTGGRYDPTADTWTATSTSDAPAGRSGHTAVWTGSEVIVWGGGQGAGLNTGGTYNPATNSWMPTSMANAPATRYVHTAVWTGTEMIVWGGLGNSYLDSGGRYNPGSNSWTATNISNAPTARGYHQGGLDRQPDDRVGWLWLQRCLLSTPAGNTIRAPTRGQRLPQRTRPLRGRVTPQCGPAAK